MLTLLLTHTPTWVWALLVGLSILGLSQVRARTVSLQRVTILPLAMVALSLYSTLSTFGLQTQVVLVWLTSFSLSLYLVLKISLNSETQYDHIKQQLYVPGSWVPLGLILGIFICKYVVGAGTAIQPQLSHNTIFSLGFAFLFGGFSGIFSGRAARYWYLVRGPKLTSLVSI
jgi:hypothetical protein